MSCVLPTLYSCVLQSNPFLNFNFYCFLQVHGLRSGLGGGAHPSHGLYFSDVTGGILFQFARLFAGSVEFREYLRFFCPADRLFSTIPGAWKECFIACLQTFYLLMISKMDKKQQCLTNLHRLPVNDPLCRCCQAPLADQAYPCQDRDRVP